MIYTNVFVFLVLCTLRSNATTISTHWMVTESGLVKPWFNSPFVMHHPYDLISFLTQSDLWESIIKSYHDLSERQLLIEKLWSAVERGTDVGHHLITNTDCLKSHSLKHLDWYVFYLQKGISDRLMEEDFLFDAVDLPNSDHSTDVPDCKKISSLTFSMIAFDHLESIKNRDSLTMSPKFSLLEIIPQMLTSKHLGHWASTVLKQNSSSWLHYKMAALHWMIKGNAPKALECSRRAVHYVPREYKDLALLMLGSVLHRSKCIEDAITVLNAAVDHNPNYHINHFILANAYALYGDFNMSLIHYNNSLNINPDFELALKHKNAVLCIESLYKKMMKVKKNLKILLEELEEFRKKETERVIAQATFLKAKKRDEDFDLTNVLQHCQKMTELTKLDMVKLRKYADKNSLLQYFFDGKMYDENWLEAKGIHILDSAYNLQKLVKNIKNHIHGNTKFQTEHHMVVKKYNVQGQLSDGVLEKILKQGQVTKENPKVVTPIEDQPEDGYTIDYETGIVLYAPNMQVNRNIEDFDRDISWPSELYCLERAPIFPLKLEAIYPVFLPFENKGIRLRKLLTDEIGVGVTEEYELPWHPPNCPQDKGVIYLTQKKASKQLFHLEVILLDNLRDNLLAYVGDGDAFAAKHMQDAEIGHRIYVAMNKKLVPKWITYTLASLYWRVRENSLNALHCLVAGSKSVPPRYRDVVFTSLASLYLEMGYFSEALKAVEQAFLVNSNEPASNFVLSELNMVKKKHTTTHLFNLKQVVRVDSMFMGGFARNLLDAWMCLVKQASDGFDNSKEDCTSTEAGINMICEKEGLNCRVIKKKCINKQEKSDESFVVTLRHNDPKDVKPDQMFDPIVKNMPKDPSNMEAHKENYKAMMKKIESAFSACGPRGCNNVAPQEMNLEEDDCSYQYLQLGYWINMVSFKEMQSDKDIRLPAELTNLPSSSVKIPECSLDKDPKLDFFLDRIVQVDTTEWEPTVTVMQQFSEMFNYFDYTTLGSKIAKYLDMKPSSWVGALGAGWWCGAGGRAACAVRCLAAAYSRAPAALAPHALRALVALLHLNSKPLDAREIAYLSFYASPKSKVDAFLVAVSHSYLEEYEQAVWMYRYSLNFDEEFLPSKACLHATLCLILFKSAKDVPQRID